MSQGISLSPDEVTAIHEAKASGLSIRKTAARLGLPTGTVSGHWPKTEQLSEKKIVQTESGTRVEFTSKTYVQTKEEAIKFAEVDLTRDCVVGWGCGGYQVVTKTSQGVDSEGRRKPDKVEKHQLWRVHLDLRPVAPASLLDACQGIYERLCTVSPKAVQRLAWTPQRVLCAVSLYDVHFGKKAWRFETGQDQDLAISDQLYRNAVQDLLSLTAGTPAEEFIFTLGQDFFHIDSGKNETTGGTRVDTDGRLAKIMQTGIDAFIWGVEETAKRGRVRVVWVPGNHDHQTSYMASLVTKAHFRHSENVTVDCSPTTRKYHRYGTNLIGMIHGHTIKAAKLPMIMATERPKDWAETTCREFHTGHWHTSKKMETLPSDQFNGVTVRSLPSLSATDAWHYDNGFTGNSRAAEAYLYDHDAGLLGCWVAPARQG